MFVLLVVSNVNPETLIELNLKLNKEYNTYDQDVLATVAIASAITSYARIHMIPYKLNEGCYYSDTDSIFTSKKLDNSSYSL